VLFLSCVCVSVSGVLFSVGVCVCILCWCACGGPVDLFTASRLHTKQDVSAAACPHKERGTGSRLKVA